MWGGEIFNAFDMKTARGMSLLGYDKRAVKIWEAAPEEKCLLLRLRPLTIYRRLSVCLSVAYVMWVAITGEILLSNGTEYQEIPDTNTLKIFKTACQDATKRLTDERHVSTTVQTNTLFVCV